MSVESAPELLVLHGLRIKGMADATVLGRRYRLDPPTVEELLLDFQAAGWVTRVVFPGIDEWTLTRAGRDRALRLVTAELEAARARDTVAAAHTAFTQLNARFLQLITDWQIRPTGEEPLAENDHQDPQWDEHVRNGLADVASGLRPVGTELANALSRFDGYSSRLAAALERADGGEREWIAAPRIDSCHTIWFELHEDLLATLGLERGRGT